MEKRCFACMNKIESNICMHCGNNNSDLSGVSVDHLNPGTFLKDKYFIGLAIEQNGEGITYIAYDAVDKKRVRIRECFPDVMCNRSKDGSSVLVKNGYEIQFKSLLTDFSELSKQLIELQSNNCLLKAKYIFTANGTIYTVYEDVAGITLTRYLRDNAGELSWEATENLFLPLLYTVKLLNANGITHRGISPETIIVTPQDELKLTGICTSGARAINSEIKAELYVGYAAPEQYQKCTSYGEWTDVYSICAVLYKTLTGTMPPRADLRDEYNKIVTPIELNAAVPQSVSDAITRGLLYRQESRTRYIKELISELYATSPAPLDRGEMPQPSRRRRKFRVPVWLIVILVTLPLLLLLFLFAYDLILRPNGVGPTDVSSIPTSSTVSYYTVDDVSSDVSSDAEKPSSTTSSAIMNNVMDKFEGQIYDDIMASEPFKAMYKFKKVEEYNEHIEIGVIIKQSPEENKIVPQGQEVTLTVSKGLRYVELPPTRDSSGISVTAEEYSKVATDLGLKVTVEQIVDPAFAVGEIVKLSVPIGEKIDRETTDSIIIYVAS